MKKAKLTPKQAMFIKEYMVDLNATQAAIKAGYSKKTARQLASRLLSNVDIQQAIATEMAKRAKKVDVSIEYVLTGLKDIHKMHKKENPGASVKAVELLGKHIGAFTDKIEHSGEVKIDGFHITRATK